MKTIALLNMKGGVGKTTLAVNLAWYLSRKGKKRVLLVDLDPQFNASQYLMSYARYDKHRKERGTVANVLLDAKRPRMELKKPEEKTGPDFSLLTGIEDTKTPIWDGKSFSSVRHYLFLLPSELELARAVKNPQGVEFRLGKLLSTWDHAFDYAFIDCAPTDTVLTATALMASDYVLVPIKPDRFSILGYSMMLEVLDEFRHDYPDPKKVQDLGVVFTMVSSNNAIETSCKAQVAKEASHVFKTEFFESDSYLRSTEEKTPVFDTRFARDLTKKSVSDLAKEVETRIAAIETAKRSAAKAGA